MLVERNGVRNVVIVVSGRKILCYVGGMIGLAMIMMVVVVDQKVDRRRDDNLGLEFG